MTDTMEASVPLATRSLLKHFLSMLLLLAISILILRHTLNHPFTTIGMGNADTEGTLWWIWSKCNGFESNSSLTHIAFPNKFYVGNLPTFNLVDAIRIWISRTQDCSPTTVISAISLLPIVALVANAWSAYLVGYVLFRTHTEAIFIAVATSMSSQVLLASRTSLSNNLLAPGLISLALVICFIETKKRIFLIGLFLAIAVQVLCNVYNGFLFSVISVGWIWILPTSNQVRVKDRLKASSAMILGALFGLGPLIQSQFYLLGDSVKRDVYRPVDMSGEVVNPLILLSRSYKWFDALFPKTFPRPESGWISIPLLLGALVLVYLLLTNIRTKNQYLKIARTNLLIAFLMSVIIFRIPGTDFIRDLYFQFFSPLRGVSNFAKGLSLLFAISFISVIRFLFQERETSNPFFLRRISFCLLTFSGIVHLVDSIPQVPSFSERTDLAPLISFYDKFPKTRQNEITAHLPDYTYQKEWGLPLRFIQLAQVMTGETIANGRDFDHRYSACNALVIPTDKQTLQLLANRGITRIVLHRNLIEPEVFRIADSFLTSHSIKRIEIKSVSSSGASDVYRALDVVIFILPMKKLGISTCVSDPT